MGIFDNIDTTLTKEEFEGLPPFLRGYAVYMHGCRKDQPNIPDEKNPYPEGSEEYKKWIEGAQLGALHAQDSEE